VRQLARDLRLVKTAYRARRRTINRATPHDSLETANVTAVREDNLAWEAIHDALDSTVPRMLEIERPSAAKPGLDYSAAWLAMLERALRETTVASAHPAAHAVQLRGTGPGSEAPARITIVLGLLEKSFPRQPRQDPFLGDELRATLRERFGWELATSTDTVDRERECFLRAMSSGTEVLYLSYSLVDSDGRPAVRSFFIDDLQAALGEGNAIPVERLAGATAIVPVGEAATSSDLTAGIAHDIWQYLPRSGDVEERRAMAFRALESLARREADVSVVRHGRRVSQRPHLEGVMPEGAPHLTLTLSASQLGSISHCTYAHFVEKVLSPIDFAPPEYGAREKGNLIHKGLMHWATALDGWTRGEAALDELHAWARDEIASWSPAKRGKDRTSRATDADLERLDALIRSELELLRQGRVARPMFAELAFGQDMEEHTPRDPASRPEAFQLDVPTSKGTVTVKFRGSMDRVDVITIGGKQYGTIIDYKSGRTSKRYADAMVDGTDLQLRLYLLVLEEFWGITPVGALYLGFGDGVRRGVVRAELAGSIAGIGEKGVELYAPNDWSAFLGDTRKRIAELVDRLVRLDITVAPRDHDCGFCELARVCRYDRWSSEAERA
jgi:ATP-dependent helicase/DNAse subunit B